jgi:hypothetical protein
MECFDLERVGDAWFCPEHRPPKKRAPRAATQTLTGAMAEFERLFAAEGSRLEETLSQADRSDDKSGDLFIDMDHALEASNNYRAELGRGLADLKKAIVAQEPPQPAKPRSTARKITKRERRGEGQGELVADEVAEEGASS